MIEATTTLHPLTEIEHCYVVGDFDVVRRGQREFVIGTARDVVAGSEPCRGRLSVLLRRHHRINRGRVAVCHASSMQSGYTSNSPARILP